MIPPQNIEERVEQFLTHMGLDGSKTFYLQQNDSGLSYSGDVSPPPQLLTLEAPHKKKSCLTVLRLFSLIFFQWSDKRGSAVFYERIGLLRGIRLHGNTQEKVSEKVILKRELMSHQVVFFQGDISLGWSVIRVICHQGGLSLMWSVIRMVFSRMIFHQGGLSSGRSFIRVAFLWGVFSSGCFLISVVFHQCGHSSGWTLIRMAFIRVVLGFS